MPSDTAADVDFVQRMRDLLGMDEKAVETLLDNLEGDDLQDLTDAVAKGDKDAAEKIVQKASNETDEEVNALFRGENLDDLQPKHKRRISNRGGTVQFGFGDDVSVLLTDKEGKKHRETGTVLKPQGPEDTETIIVRVKGKSIPVHKTDVSRLKEAVIGMVGIPGLNRMQQLAGIQPQEMMSQEPVEPEMADDDDDFDEPVCDPVGKALAALNALESVLPDITLADLKRVKDRMNLIQTRMNENAVGRRSLLGRGRKL